MAVLLDSGFLLASLNSSEAEHQSTITVLESIREPIILPVPAITEVAYLLARDIGNDAAADFISSLAIRPHGTTNHNKIEFRRLNICSSTHSRVLVLKQFSEDTANADS